MLDRLRSGAGAISDQLDRIFSGGAGRRLGSIGAIVLLLGAAVGAGLAWREATDNPTPRPLTAAEASTTGDLGRRTYTEISGAYSMTYVERYEDTNDNGSQDPDETGMEWVYILTSGDPPVGLFVQSDRPPQEVLARSFAGSLVNDRASVAEVAGILGDAGGIVIDPDLYLDTSVEAVDPEPFDPGAADRPGPGTTATVDGSVHTTVVPVCPTDPACELQDAIAFVYLVYHPDDDRGLLVYSESAPVGLVDGTVTGMIRIGSDRVADLLTTYAAALDLAGAGITISGERFLDASARPASAPLVGLLAVVSLLAAAVLAVGRISGPVVYRREPWLPGDAGTTPLTNEVAVRVTGLVERSGRLTRVREAPAVVKHIVLRPPDVPAAASASIDPESAPSLEDGSATALGTTDVERPLAVELEPTTGVVLGKGALHALSAGTARLFRGPRPALRLRAGTGHLLLTFADEAARDHVRGALVAEAGLVLEPSGIARDRGS